MSSITPVLPPLLVSPIMATDDSPLYSLVYLSSCPSRPAFFFVRDFSSCYYCRTEFLCPCLGCNFCFFFFFGNSIAYGFRLSNIAADNETTAISVQSKLTNVELVDGGINKMLYDYFTIFLHYLSTTRESNTPFAQIKGSPKAAHTLTPPLELFCATSS